MKAGANPGALCGRGVVSGARWLSVGCRYQVFVVDLEHLYGRLGRRRAADAAGPGQEGEHHGRHDHRSDECEDAELAAAAHILPVQGIVVGVVAHAVGHGGQRYRYAPGSWTNV